jgi:hypothetical protein
MSEIVRPTRDGIHGREYISTAVDIGPKPMRLRFSPDGRMLTPPSRLLEIQLPAILDVPALPVADGILARVRVEAARKLATLAVMSAPDAAGLPDELLPFAVPIVGGGDVDQARGARMVELQDCAEAPEIAGKIRSLNPQAVIAVRVPLRPSTAERVIELARAGIKVFHLCADLHGREQLGAGRPGRHIKDVLREVHGRLVQEGLRDEITLLVSGGIALAEHMAKAIICGADLVAVDTPLLVALGCRVCRGGHEMCSDDSCPAEIGSADQDYATQRIVNLMGAWHDQLIEVLGAMGIREVRRLRGEVGRAIFMEDIEKEAFGDIARVPQKQVRA